MADDSSPMLEDPASAAALPASPGAAAAPSARGWLEAALPADNSEESLIPAAAASTSAGAGSTLDAATASMQADTQRLFDVLNSCAATVADMPDSTSGGASSSTVAPPPSTTPPALEPSVFEVKIKCIDSTTTMLQVPSDLRGADLKELIAERLEAPVERQRLIFRGKVVKDDDTVGQHITENGQMLHMVQRPVPAADSEGRVAGAAQSAEDQAGNGPQMHFQFATMDGMQMPQGMMPQVDLSQILGVLGAVGRGNGAGMAHAVPAGGNRPGSNTRAAHEGQGARRGPPTMAAVPGQNGATGTATSSGQPPGTDPTYAAVAAGLLNGGPGMATMPMGADGAAGLPGTFDNVQPGMGPGQMPLGHGQMPPRPGEDAAAVFDMQPMQIVFQQGLGSFAEMIPGMLSGDAMQLAEMLQPGVNGAQAHRGRGSQPGQAGAGGSQRGHAAAGDQLPWRDLRRLHQHLSRLLGRSSRNRTIPPLNMPGGEINTFLSMLLGTITQLGVAVSDLQAAFLEDAGPQPRYRLQLAMALVAAARTLRGMATALQSGPFQGSTESALAPATENESNAEAAEGAAPQDAQPEAPDGPDLDDPPPMPTPLINSSDSEEAGGDNEVGEEALQRPSEEEVFLDPVQEVFVAGPQGSGQAVVISAASGSTGAADELTPEMLQQFFGQQPQQQGSASVGEGRPGPDVLATMPPEVAACWQRWTQPDSFSRVLAQAQQPAFSHAYASGETTASQRPPLLLPEPAEFLPLRWYRTANSVEADNGEPPEHELPEPPEHLSRAYLSAFLRDAGRFAQGSSNFQSSPEAAERFPHLSRYAGLFSQEGSTNTAPLTDASAHEPSEPGTAVDY